MLSCSHAHLFSYDTMTCDDNSSSGKKERKKWQNVKETNCLCNCYLFNFVISFLACCLFYLFFPEDAILASATYSCHHSSLDHSRHHSFHLIPISRKLINIIISSIIFLFPFFLLIGMIHQIIKLSALSSGVTWLEVI